MKHCNIHNSLILPPPRIAQVIVGIENPYTQWVWIANPDQRHGVEHPQGREIFFCHVRNS